MKRDVQAMSIGALSKRSGVGVETIRYYERIGLLKPMARTPAGYRMFSNDSFKTIRFLKHAQELGFSLSEIKDLLRLRADKESKCEEVQSKATKHLREVDAKIAKLENIRAVLTQLVRQCRARKTKDACPILECFDERGSAYE